MPRQPAVAPSPSGSPPASSPGEAGPGMTVDDLARAARTTTRQVRALQTRGLLPHPRLLGRTGFYDAAHLDRLRAVLRLQAGGFTLTAIAALVRAWESDLTLAEVIGFPPSRPAGPEESDLFEGYAAPWRGRLLTIVPSTVLAEPAAS